MCHRGRQNSSGERDAKISFAVKLSSNLPRYSREAFIFSSELVGHEYETVAEFLFMRNFHFSVNKFFRKFLKMKSYQNKNEKCEALWKNSIESPLDSMTSHRITCWIAFAFN